jgi:arginine N-succinyltransferase
VLILRPVERSDLDELVALARRLDSVNLPADAPFLEQRIDCSLRSFGDASVDWQQGLYVFVLEDTADRRVLGTSMVRAKHGTPDAPYYYLEVSTEERRSTELSRHFEHTKLQLGISTDGPSEIGGLVLHPDWRGHPEKCGKALSVVRFAWIGAHPDRFEREVVAEMLSRFDAEGHNRLWDAFGAHFTGLSYREADHLSARNPRFIADLFPQDPVYATLFPEEVRQVLGQPNETARAAVHILEKVGFHYLRRIDPFDGGPYYGAARDAIASVRERRELVLPSVPAERSAQPEGPLALLSAEGAHGFRAAVLALDAEGAPFVPKDDREALGVGAGDRVSITPLP